MGLEGVGDIAVDVADVAQCIRVILLTRKGEDPLRPLFGCGLYQYIDRPIAEVVPAIIREVSEAVALWEKRVKLNGIRVSNEGSTLALELDVTLIRGGTMRVYTINIGGIGSPSVSVAFDTGFSNGFS